MGWPNRALRFTRPWNDPLYTGELLHEDVAEKDKLCLAKELFDRAEAASHSG
ncbi:MAG: hypothetical protein ACREJM_16115 [Candidatus Saccharimonadales bacterium]